MTKKRRTRQEKINAQSRKNSFDFVFKAHQENKEITKTSVVTAKKNYSYIISETRNTLLITAIITAINIVLFVALKQNYINIFGLEF